MPSGGLEFVVMIVVTFVCLHFRNTRTWCMIFALTMSLVGTIMIFAAPYHDKAALLCGYYMVYQMVVCNSWLALIYAAVLCFPYQLHSPSGLGISQRCRTHKEGCQQLATFDWI
jgi:hypothetical protein